MKKLKQIVGVIIVTVLMMSSFVGNAQITLPTNSTDIVVNDNSKKSNKYVPSDFEYIGIDHNQMLDRLLSKLKNNKKENFKSTIVNVFSNYAFQKGIYSNDDIQNGVNQLEKINTNDYLLNGNLYNKEIRNKITNKTAFYLDKLNDILKEKKINGKLLTRKVTNLERLISSDNLSNNELVILFSATNMAKYSYNYWEKNMSKWSSNKYETKSGPGPGSIIAGADVAGAIGGAVYAAVINVVPGAGQAAYGATILATGLGASASAAVGLIWNWIFK